MTQNTTHHEKAALSLPRARYRARPFLAARDSARLAARGGGRQRNEGRLRRRRLRRLHRGAGAAERGRLPTSPSTPASCCSASSTAPSSSRSRIWPTAARSIRCSRRWSTSRLAVRLLHARHRDEPVRRLSFRRARDTTRGSTTSLPAISAAAPATARSSRRRFDLRLARPPTVSPQRRRARRGAGRACRRKGSLRRRRDALSSPRPRASIRSPRSTRAFPTRRSSAARPTLASGSPSSCATSSASFGSAGLPARQVGESADGALSLGAGVDARATRRRYSARSIPISANSCAASARCRCGRAEQSAAISPTVRQSAISRRP